MLFACICSGVDIVIENGIKALRANMVEINREHWMKDAEDCDKYGSTAVAQAIVRNVISLNVDDEDRKDTWYVHLDDLQFYLATKQVPHSLLQTH